MRHAITLQYIYESISKRLTGLLPLVITRATDLVTLQSYNYLRNYNCKYLSNYIFNSLIWELRIQSYNYLSNYNYNYDYVSNYLSNYKYNYQPLPLVIMKAITRATDLVTTTTEL